MNQLPIIDFKGLVSLKKLFPELTTSQFEITILFCIGVSIKEISHYRSISYSCVDNTLNNVKEKYNIPNLNNLRLIFLLRFFLSK